MALFELFYSLIFMNPFIYPQTFSAISLTSFNFAHCSSSVSLLPISQEAKPHCGLRQRRSDLPGGLSVPDYSGADTQQQCPAAAAHGRDKRHRYFCRSPRGIVLPAAAPEQAWSGWQSCNFS